MPAPYRRFLGSKFSEGSRLLWGTLGYLAMCPCDMARTLRVSSALMCRWLYGERRPSEAMREHIEMRLGIPAPTWDSDSVVDFLPPAINQ